ncbi:NAD(P)-binding protein [Abortiporus biennis]|nr:NAD(P)-binding protein [Abortiporus biennis]
MTIPEQFRKGYKPPFQQQESTPGSQKLIHPQPINDITADGKHYKSSGKLEGRTALVTGADSGIGRAIALLFALEGANLTLHCTKQEHEDVKDIAKEIIEKTDNKSKMYISELDLRSEDACKKLVESHLHHFGGKLDALVLNHGNQQSNTDITTLPSEQWLQVFDTNIHSFFYICKAAIPHMPEGSSIVFDASVNFAIGHPQLLDYTATKGAIIAFMRGLSNQIVGDKGIRCNAVAPGPIWTPLIPPTMTKESLETFGSTVPMGRPGQPIEIATVFVFLSSADSSYISGQVIHVNGGTVIN